MFFNPLANVKHVAPPPNKKRCIRPELVPPDPASVQNSKSGLQRLPETIKIELFTYFDPADHARCARVNKLMGIASRDWRSWACHVQTSCTTLNNYGKVSGFSVLPPMIHSRVKSLQLDCTCSCDIRLQLHGCEFETRLKRTKPNLGQLCPALERLELRFYPGTPQRCTRYMFDTGLYNCATLQHLVVTFETSGTGKQTPVALDYITSLFPQLRSLELDHCYLTIKEIDDAYTMFINDEEDEQTQLAFADRSDAATAIQKLSTSLATASAPGPLQILKIRHAHISGKWNDATCTAIAEWLTSHTRLQQLALVDSHWLWVALFRESGYVQRPMQSLQHLEFGDHDVNNLVRNPVYSLPAKLFPNISQVRIPLTTLLATSIQSVSFSHVKTLELTDIYGASRGKTSITNCVRSIQVLFETFVGTTKLKIDFQPKDPPAFYTCLANALAQNTSVQQFEVADFDPQVAQNYLNFARSNRELLRELRRQSVCLTRIPAPRPSDANE